jgi:hypothetical protein
MYRLDSTYGFNAYQAWIASGRKLDDLRPHKQSGREPQPMWSVRSYTELVEAVAFLSVMNKRLILYFRGQSGQFPLVSSLLRDEWHSSILGRTVLISKHRTHYKEELTRIGSVAYRACEEFGLPRWRTIKTFPEAQWAIVQHYELWPTPFLDVTRSLRVAASFALGWAKTAWPHTGYLYVLGMPVAHDSISISFDEQLMLVRLEAVCPPSAKRPHFQEGALLSRFPFTDRELSPRRRDRNDASRRLVGRFELIDDDGSFWSDLPQLSQDALLPADDQLLHWFEENTLLTLDDDGVAHLVESAA